LKGPARIAVFASGGGTNLQALIDRFNRRAGGVARVELVVGSRPGIGALERAAAAGVATVVVGAGPGDGVETGEELLRLLDSRRIDLIVLAGYLKLVPGTIVQRFQGRMLNIHPALLPAFGGPGMYGLRVHRAVLASGARVSGATVHFVDERYDEGRILAQWPVPVLPDDSPESLAARILRVEHLLLPAAIEALVRRSEAAPPADPISFELRRSPLPEEASVGWLTSIPEPPRSGGAENR
jgi:phosphoribosylglycinamide formyltransferase 1